MNRFTLAALLSILSFSLCFPQTKKLTVEDAIFNQKTTLGPKRYMQLQWIPSGNNYSYIDHVNKKLFLMKGTAGSDKRDTILTMDNFNKKLAEMKMQPSMLFPSIEWTNENTFRILKDDTLLAYNSSTGKLTFVNNIDKDAELVEINRRNGDAAFTKGNNLYLKLVGHEAVQITNDTNKDIVNGQAVHRNEFGIDKGIFWSPSASLLAFYRMDQTMVTDYPLVDINEHPAKVENIKYPMAGQVSHQVTIGIYNIKNRTTVWLKTGEPNDQYLTNVTWSPDEKLIYVAHLNRGQDTMRLITYDPLTGNQVKVLFTETDKEYVEPEEGPVFVRNDPARFIWLSERDGWKHFYLYNSEGTMIKQVTKGNWEVTDYRGIDKDGKHIFFMSTKESPLERHFYIADIQSGEMRKLTSERGTHNVYSNGTGEFFLDSFNSMDVPLRITIMDLKGKPVSTVLSSDNPLKDYAIGATSLVTLKSKGGFDLYSRVILPPNFDSSKKYPVMVYVYGGPHSQLVSNSWLAGSSLWFYYMAQEGYIVYTLDNRGTDYRGMDFEQATFRHLGTKEIEDQLTGIDYLKSLPYVDASRIGVFGWSYGGFIATSLMTKASDVFKVGVAGGPVIDWSYYEIMYTERYMDTPETNLQGYNESSLLNYVDSLKGKLLLIHGTSDPTVVWQNSLLFVQSAVMLGVPLDYFPYPGHGHGVLGHDALHLYNKITDYLKSNL